MFLLLLDDLAQGLENGMGEVEKAEINATFLYTFIGVIMPPYCQTRYVCIPRDTVREIHSDGAG